MIKVGVRIIAASSRPLDTSPARAERRGSIANHSWPANIRELRNVLERACVASSDRTALRTRRRISEVPDC
ncbi:AAA-type ATPase lid domain-containing protein [Paraburkholderia antibiotica]